MIFIGYPGVGKSSITKEGVFIDLESSLFSVNGVKPTNWHIIYGNVAMELNRQGFYPLVSSHSLVTEYLMSKCKEDCCVIYPAIELKEQWIDKLKKRCLETRFDKDTRAYTHSNTFYEEDINHLENLDCEHIKLETTYYRLLDCIRYYLLVLENKG